MSTAPPLDDDNLLPEILLRLPPQPSSLPRASLVCKRWRRLVSDPGFGRRFRLHHRPNPPLLGCFVENGRALSFLPTMEAPNRVPPGRFSLQFHNCSKVLGCRHGLVLFFDAPRKQVLVWDPVTAHQNRIALPAGFDVSGIKVQGTVLRAAGDVQHFQVVLAVADMRVRQHRRALACIYSSTTGLWGSLVSTPITSKNPTGRRRIIFLSGNRARLVGNSLYCLIDGSFVGLLEFDLERQTLTVINLPVDVYAECKPWDLMVMRAEGGGLGLFFLSDFTAQLWKRTTDGDGNASWVLGRTIELDKLFSLNSEKERGYLCILGYAEDNNVVFLVTLNAVFMIHLESLQFKKLSRHNKFYCYHPFESVYAAEACVSGGHDEAGVLVNTSTG